MNTIGVIMYFIIGFIGGFFIAWILSNIIES